jgi:hypothetical protein
MQVAALLEMVHQHILTVPTVHQTKALMELQIEV